MRVSVIIPSRNEIFLQQTIDDVLAKAHGDVEVVPVLDRYIPDPPLKPDSRIKPVERRTESKIAGMRDAINMGVAAATGDFIMKLDAHCMMCEGWDEILKAECDRDWVVIPRRYSLDPIEWSIRSHRPVVDYEFISFPYLDEFTSVRTSNKWFTRAEERKDILVDDNMSFQGSCYFMYRDYYKWLGILQTEGYDGMILEAEEISCKAWLTGGKVMTNKKAWYAHLHKGKQFGRMYFINKWELRRGRRYHIDLWMNDKWPRATKKMEWLIDHFWPVPTWPDDWRDPKYKEQYLAGIGK